MTELRCYYSPPLPPQNEALKPLSAEAQSFRGGEIYEHYKGKRYKIQSIGRNSETLEEIVVYQALYGDHDVWVRALSMFLEDIVINGQPQPRFKQVQQNFIIMKWDQMLVEKSRFTRVRLEESDGDFLRQQR